MADKDRIEDLYEGSGAGPHDGDIIYSITVGELAFIYDDLVEQEKIQGEYWEYLADEAREEIVEVAAQEMMDSVSEEVQALIEDALVKFFAQWEAGEFDDNEETQ